MFGKKMKIFLVTLCFMLSISAVNAASDVNNVTTVGDDCETGDLDVDPPSGINLENIVTYSSIKNVNSTSEPIISSEDMSMYYKNGSRYEVYVYQDSNIIRAHENTANSSVIFNINGINYTRELVNGKASIGINLIPGNYSVTTFYHYGNKLISKTNNIEILSTIYGGDIVKLYRNGTQYYAMFLDGDGSPLVGSSVTFNINGVFYERQTNASGVARLNINLLPGKYILTAIHQNGEEKSDNITVLSTISAENITLTENVEGILTLKTFDGTNNVSIVVNGIEYIVQTDKEGIATLKLNLTKGTYVAHSTNLKSKEELDTTIYVVQNPDLVQYYDCYGVSPDGKYIMSIGRPSASGELSAYGYKFYKSVFTRICPCCGSDKLYWGIFWAGSETANWGVFPATGNKESGSAEGHIFCAYCDADFSAIDGKNHGGDGKNLKKVSSTTASSKDEAYLLKNGKIVYSSEDIIS